VRLQDLIKRIREQLIGPGVLRLQLSHEKHPSLAAITALASGRVIEQFKELLDRYAS